MTTYEYTLYNGGTVECGTIQADNKTDAKGFITGRVILCRNYRLIIKEARNVK